MHFNRPQIHLGTCCTEDTTNEHINKQVYTYKVLKAIVLYPLCL